jgi:hypothetical protein
VHFQPTYGSVSRLRIAHNPRRTGVVSVNETAHQVLVAADLPQSATQ